MGIGGLKIGRLKIGENEYNPHIVIECVELNKIFAALFLDCGLAAGEFEKAKIDLLRICVSERVRVLLLLLRPDQAAMLSVERDNAYRMMDQTCLQSLRRVASPPIEVMWPKDFTTIEANTLLCLQDESILVRHPSPIRWLGTTGLTQSIVWYIFNEDMSFFLHTSPGTLNFETNVRQSIAENLHIESRQPINVMILGGLADRNNVLVMSLYHLALLAKERGCVFNITYQATLNRNLHPSRIPPEQWSACDKELMRMTAYAALKEKMILVYKTFCPEVSLDLLHETLDMPHDEVMTDKISAAPLTLPQLEQLVEYLCSFSMVSQKHNSGLISALTRYCPTEMSAEPAERQEGLMLLFQMILHSASTPIIYFKQCSDTFYISKFSAFIIDLANQCLSLLPPHALGVAQTLRNPLFTTPPNPAVSFLRHIKADYGYRIFLPLRTIDPYWDADRRTTILGALRDAKDLPIPITVWRRPGYVDEPDHKESMVRQIFEFCLHLNTATSPEPLALLRAAIFSRHDRNATQPTHLELLTLTYMYLLLAGLSAQGNVVEIHRRNAPNNERVDAVIASTPDAERQISDRLSRSGKAIHYQISLAENEAHCIYVENAHLPALRFFRSYLVPQSQPYHYPQVRP